MWSKELRRFRAVRKRGIPVFLGSLDSCIFVVQQGVITPLGVLTITCLLITICTCCLRVKIMKQKNIHGRLIELKGMHVSLSCAPRAYVRTVNKMGQGHRKDPPVALVVVKYRYVLMKVNMGCRQPRSQQIRKSLFCWLMCKYEKTQPSHPRNAHKHVTPVSSFAFTFW